MKNKSFPKSLQFKLSGGKYFNLFSQKQVSQSSTNARISLFYPSSEIDCEVIAKSLCCLLLVFNVPSTKELGMEKPVMFLEAVLVFI